MRISLYGGPGCGKCFAANTEILMFDGTIKKVQDIKVGDLVMGPDSKSRMVLNLARGREKLYRISSKSWGKYKKKTNSLPHPYCQDSYTVNESHILTLKKGGIFRDKADALYSKAKIFQSSGKGIKECRCGIFIGRTTLKCPVCDNIFGEMKTERYQDHFSKVGDVYNISIHDYLNESQKFKQVMKGYRVGIDFSERSLRIDPYFLGLWLGDGSSNGPEITNIDSEIVSAIYDEAQKRNLEVKLKTSKVKRCPTYRLSKKSCDLNEDEILFYNIYLDYKIKFGYGYLKEMMPEIKNQIKINGWFWLENISESTLFRKIGKVKKYLKSNNLPTNFGKNKIFGNSLVNDLRFYNLIKNKHIPFDYLINSRTNRLKLLAGIIDTDGYLSKSKTSRNYEITTKFSQLARDIVFLARSLGFYATAKESYKYASNTDKKIKHLYWRIIIGGNIKEIPVKLEHKKTEFVRTIRDPLTYQIKVDAIGEGDYYGFAIDGDNLFLLADFTVVHNSTLASKIFADLREKQYSVELVSEYIKSWAYQKRIPKSFDQLYIFGKQVHAEDLVWQAGVKHLVTDSPLLMQGFYAKTYNTPVKEELISLAKKYEKVHPALNIFLNREGIPYHQNGRYENSDEALERDRVMFNYLIEEDVNFVVFKTTEYNSIIDYIEKNISEE